MNNICVTTKCKYCELVLLMSDNSFFQYQYRCTAQKDAPRVYSDSDCPYKRLQEDNKHD